MREDLRNCNELLEKKFNVTIVWLPRKASVTLEESSSVAGITHTAKCTTEKSKG